MEEYIISKSRLEELLLKEYKLEQLEDYDVVDWNRFSYSYCAHDIDRKLFEFKEYRR